MSKVSLAEQIGQVAEIIEENEKVSDYRSEQRVRRLKAAKASLSWLLNNRDACVAYMEGKKE